MVGVAYNGVVTIIIMTMIFAAVGVPSLVFGFRALDSSCGDLAKHLIITASASLGIILVRAPFVILIFKDVGIIRFIVMLLTGLFMVGWGIRGAIIVWSDSSDLRCRYDDERPVWILSTICVIGSILSVCDGKNIRKWLNDDYFLSESQKQISWVAF